MIMADLSIHGRDMTNPISKLRERDAKDTRCHKATGKQSLEAYFILYRTNRWPIMIVQPSSMPENPGTALITGAAKRIGRTIALHLAEAGYAIAIHHNHSGTDATTLADDIAQKGGRTALVQADLSDPLAVEGMIDQAVDQLGPVTLLVNNASLFEKDEATDFNLTSWNKHQNINLLAPLILAREMANALPTDRKGAIVNIIDQRVWKLTPQFFSYTLSKAGLHTATTTLAQALAPRIRVNAVGPGPTLGNERQDPADFEKQSKSVMLGRGPSPREIADAVLFLASAESITGQMIAVDGGQHLAWQTADVWGIKE